MEGQNEFPREKKLWVTLWFQFNFNNKENRSQIRISKSGGSLWVFWSIGESQFLRAICLNGKWGIRVPPWRKFLATCNYPTTQAKHFHKFYIKPFVFRFLYKFLLLQSIPKINSIFIIPTPINTSTANIFIDIHACALCKDDKLYFFLFLSFCF